MTVANIRHTGIVVSNMETSLRFYRDILGMAVWEDATTEGAYIESLTAVPGARIWTVKLRTRDGGSIELLKYLNRPEETPPRVQSCHLGCNHVALQVENLDGLYWKLLHEGIEFHAPPSVSPTGRFKVAYCRDPEGVILELVEAIAASEQ